MTDSTTTDTDDRRLNSWKEIAAFFGKDQRTVKRWETVRGLPVRRVPGGTRTSVFAYVSELEAWLSTPRPAPAAALASIGAQSLPQRRLAFLPALIAAAIVVTAASLLIGGLLPAPRTKSTDNVPPAAQELYRDGVVAWSARTADGFNTALGKFNAALAIAPDYARAEAGLANVYNLISQYTLAPAAESYAKGRAAAERAIQLDPNLADGYAALAFNVFNGSHEFAHSAELFDKALSLDPDNAQTLHWYALTSMQMGKFDRPLALINHALELQPDSRSIKANAALIRYYAGDRQSAIDMLEQLRQANPDYLAVPSYLATIYLDLGRYSDFLDNYEVAAKVEGSEGRQAIAKAARAALPQGGHAMLTAMLAEQKIQFAAGRETAYKVAATAALLGNKAEALDYLDIAVERSETIGLLVEPEFKSLRGEPHFRKLLATIGLPAN